MTELTFTILKYAVVIGLWLFMWVAVRSLHSDMNAYSPISRHGKKNKHGRSKNNNRDNRAISPDVVRVGEREPGQAPVHITQAPSNIADNEPSLLVIIDGPLAGSTVSLTGQPITLGRSADNTIVLNDEYVSSSHARVSLDPSSNQWILTDLGSTNGTYIDEHRVTQPVILPPRVPVRIGATTFELR